MPTNEDHFDGFREMWVPSGKIPDGTRFFFELRGDEAFVSFPNWDKSTALFLGKKNDRLRVSECGPAGKWNALADQVRLQPGDAVRLAVEVTGQGAVITGTCLAGPIAISADLTAVAKVCAAGHVSDFDYSEPLSETVTKARNRVLRSTAALPQGNGLPKRHEDLIYDFGVWNGDDTQFYLAKGFRVVAIEANPQLAERNARRFASEILSGQLTLLNLGLADRATVLPFYISLATSEQSSFDGKMARRKGPVRETAVETVSPADLWSAFGVPYYLKIDIEGYDQFIIASLRDLPDVPRYVSFECAYEGWNGAIGLLSDVGYARFKAVDQMKVPSTKLPQPSREGRYVDHSFHAGSSGPFGAETPGDWCSADAVQAALDDLRRRNPDNKGWIDIHAAL